MPPVGRTLTVLMPALVMLAGLLLLSMEAPSSASPASSPAPLLASSQAPAVVPAAGPIFRFEADEFWLNAHHFLYVLGRAEAKMRDASRDAVAGAPAEAERGLATLSEDERQIWREAVTAYATGLSRKDAVFDEPLPAMASALARAKDARSLSGAADVDAGTRAVLERAAPIYRKGWWPAHQASNRAWQASTQTLVDRHGQATLAFLTKVYGLQWPADGYVVHLAKYANWAGAYSTSGHLLVVSTAGAASTRGLYGLEIAFHEGMHQWDDAVVAALREQARRTGAPLRGDLSHAMIFYTAGEAVKRVEPSHVPYAEAFGIWTRGLGVHKAALDDAWKPYLDGRGTRDDALAALVGKSAPRP